MFRNLFKKRKIIIGMIHLPSLLVISDSGDVKKIIKKALKDLYNLEKAGFDAVLIENDNDKPHTEFATEEQTSLFTAIAWEICKKAKVPVGVQMMLNDWKSSFAIAKAVGAEFTRLDVFVDHMASEWGEIKPDPKMIMRYKNEVYPGLILLADIQAKHKKLIGKKSILRSAAQAIKNGADALVVTGLVTGEETPLKKIIKVKKAFLDFPVLVGAGVNSKNIGAQLDFADGAIVGTSIKSGNYIDYKKAKRLIDSFSNLKKM